MKEETKFESRIMDLIIKKLEERNLLDYWDFNHYQIRELWVNRTLK